jgi:hypothetical protein
MSSIFSTNQANGIPVRQACTVLYDALPDLKGPVLHSQLENLVGPCTVEWAVIAPAADAPPSASPMLGGVATFSVPHLDIEHRVALVALSVAVRPDVLDVTVGVSPMADDQREAFRTHNAAIRLFYMGDAIDPVDQLIALHSVAGAALRLGSVGLINERAALALPTEAAEAFLPQLNDEVPPIQLWTGALTFTVNTDAAGNPVRFLLRTYGMDQCALPELGTRFTDLSLVDDTYHTLMNVCLYFVQHRNTVPLGAGDRVEFGGRTYILAGPDSDDWDAASSTGLLLLVEV